MGVPDCSVIEISDEDKNDPIVASNVNPKRQSTKETQVQRNGQELDNRIKNNHSVLHNMNENLNDGATTGQHSKNKCKIEDQINSYRVKQKRIYKKRYTNRCQQNYNNYCRKVDQTKDDLKDVVIIEQNENKHKIEDQINEYRLKEESVYENRHTNRRQENYTNRKQPKAPRRMQPPFRQRFVDQKSQNRSRVFEADWLNYLQHVRYLTRIK